MSEPLLDEKIVALHRALAEAGIPHAFGGALALAYHATPRATHDIDVNVFVPSDAPEPVLRVLDALGVRTGGARTRERIVRDGQARVRWGRTPIDLFFSYDPLHASALERVRELPFGDEDRIPVLSAEDLALFKVLYDRPKDWRDVREMVVALGPELDAAYLRRWARRILDEGDPRLTRLEELLGPARG